MDIDKIADRILEDEWEYIDDSFNGEFWELTFSASSLKSVIIKVLKEELNKGKDADYD